MRSLSVRPEADADILQAVIYYEEQSPGLSLRFEAELHSRLDRIRESPDGYALVEHGYRQAMLGRFPYSIVFYATDARVVVAAVPHHSRDQRSWLRRLKPR